MFSRCLFADDTEQASTVSAVFDTGVLVPPRLVRYVEATLPSTVQLDAPTAVTAKLSLNANGGVDEVEILEGAADAVDEAATAAMAQFVFEPATKAGIPVNCEVIYKYQFTPVLLREGDDGVDASARADDNTASSQQDENMDAPVESDEYLTVVHDERDRPEMTLRVITSAEIQRIPGTHGDAVLAIQTMPGVAKPPALLGALIVRGSAAHDTIALVDGLYAPSIFHFSAVNAIINSDLIDTVSFYPGNFSVRYGRGTGGVVDIKTRSPRLDRFHAYVDADLWDATVFAEGPVSKKWSVAASFRRSYIDGVLRGTGLLENQLRFTVAPRYYDFQIVGDYHPTHKDSIRLVVFGSDDKVKFGSGLLDGNINIGAYLNTHAYGYQMGVHWEHRLEHGARNTLSFGGGFFGAQGEVSTVERTKRGVPFHFRDEVRFDVSRQIHLSLGIDTAIGGIQITDEDMIQGGRRLSENQVEAHPGLFAELVLRAFDPIVIIYGLRCDYDTTIKHWTVDPRMSARYQPLPWITLKAGFGLFHQAPSMFNEIVRTDERTLEPASAIHYSFGVEQTVPTYRFLTLSVEGFFKDLRKTLVVSPSWGRFYNGASGRAVGLEVMLTHHPKNHFFGWLSYTLSKSERYRNDGSGIPFSYDQTHVLTLVGGVSLPHSVELGVRFRLASGFPYTPIVGIQFIDSWSAGYVGILGDENSARMPMFHQLDVRIDKSWTWHYLSLRLYLDIQNIYNRQNPVFYIYNESYTKKKPVYDLPIVPSIGVRVTY